MDRRRFLAGGAGAVAMGAAVQALSVRSAAAAAGAVPSCDGKGLGPLLDTPDLTDGHVRLGLPAGWTYRSVGGTGTIMTDGVATPGRQDGMAAFWGPNGTIRVVRNHEERESAAAGVRPFPGRTSDAYDRNVIGGTTTLEIDPSSRQLLRHWLSLNGTTFNCAGGPTPWGTWISCEESVNGPDVGPDFAGNGPDFERPHGFLFEVDPAAEPGRSRGRPIKKAGRFAHEAAAIDPRTGVLYQTEDRFEGPSGFYRYTTRRNPVEAGQLLDGGRLEMLRIQGASTPTELGGVLPEGGRVRRRLGSHHQARSPVVAGQPHAERRRHRLRGQPGVRPQRRPVRQARGLLVRRWLHLVLVHPRRVHPADRQPVRRVRQRLRPDLALRPPPPEADPGLPVNRPGGPGPARQPDGGAERCWW